MASSGESSECPVQIKPHSSSERLVSKNNSSWLANIARAGKRRCISVILLLVFMLAVLVTVIVVPLVVEKGPVHKKYQKHIVSVISEEKQKLLLLLAKQSCYKKALIRRKELTNTTNVSSKCRVAWDGVLCWDQAQAGTVAVQQCPDYVNAFNTNGFVTRICTENGTWWINPDPNVNNTWTNFSECIQPAIDLSFHAAQGDKLRLLYTIGYSFSLGALLVAIIIMLCCKRLHSKSNTLHVNLFLAFILRAIVSFLKDILFVENVGLAKDVRRGSDGMLEFVQDSDDTHWECKLLIIVFMYCVNACNMWIFAEALYLTMLVSRPLATERNGVKLYVVLGWSLSFAFIVPWIIVKSLYENTFCWNIQQNPDYYWILRGSGVAVVVINFFLFLNIFFKLFMKLRQSSQLGAYGKSKYRKLAKFILVLIPLFGIMYILFYVAVPSNFEETDFNVAYLYLEMGYNSFQGFVLALLFCFLNEEVHGELKRVWQRHRSRRQEMSNFKSYWLHSSSHKNQSTINKSDVRKTSHGQKELHHLRTFSVSSDRSSDIEPGNNVSANKLNCTDQIPSNESKAQTSTQSSATNGRYSHFPDIDHSDSLLRHAILTNTRQKLKRQSNTESAVSHSMYPSTTGHVDTFRLCRSSSCEISKL